MRQRRRYYPGLGVSWLSVPIREKCVTNPRGFKLIIGCRRDIKREVYAAAYRSLRSVCRRSMSLWDGIFELDVMFDGESTLSNIRIKQVGRRR